MQVIQKDNKGIANNIKIFISYHKFSVLLKSEIFEPIHVGRTNAKNNSDLRWLEKNMIGDDTGDNISFKNFNYCELTAQYWAWKNYDADYVGFMHYRKLFNLRSVNNDEINEIIDKDFIKYGWNKENIEKLFSKYDIILPLYFELSEEITNIYDFYKKERNIKELDVVIDVIKNDYPKYVSSLEKYLSGTRSLFCNMFIMKKDLFNEYSEWLFGILAKSEKLVKFSDGSNYKGLFSFLSEKLLNVFVLYKIATQNIRCYYAGTVIIQAKAVDFDRKKINLGKNIYLMNKYFGIVERVIDIVFAVDDRYCQHCSVAIVSILLNCDKSSKFRFHILCEDLCEKSKNKLLSLRNLRSFEMEFYDLHKFFDFSQFPLNRGYISKVTYYRLLLIDILPKNIEKVIYLDCDIVVEKDLKELWGIDISEYLAGVCEDEGSVTHQRRMRLPSQNNYFNAGVIVFNVKKLKTFDLKQKCLNYYKANRDIITLQDQDILNGVLNGRCKYLPICWNTNARIYFNNDLEHTYTREQEVEAGYNPGIIHYTDSIKPWNSCCTHILKSEYWKYLSYTGYKLKYYVYKVRTNFEFIYKFEKTKKFVCVKIFKLPIYELKKFGKKIVRVLGMTIFIREKSNTGYMVKIFGIIPIKIR